MLQYNLYDYDNKKTNMKKHYAAALSAVLSENLFVKT
jgi:hypothetical protein